MSRDSRTGYGRIPILNGVSFSVGEGEFIGILGHNGMGKTTLLKALMGFCRRPAGACCSAMTTSRRPSPIAARGSGSATCRRAARFSRPHRLRQSAHGLHTAGGRRGRHHCGRAGGIPAPESAARSGRRRAVGRRAAIARDRALPVRRSEAGVAGRTDRRHPALDHRRDRRNAVAVARREAGSP